MASKKGRSGKGWAKLPPIDEVIATVERHPELSYAKIHALYGWKGSPNSVRGALNRAGYRRNSRHINIGGGPMDIMPSEEFWGQVKQQARETEMKLRARIYRTPNTGSFRGTETATRHLSPAD